MSEIYKPLAEDAQRELSADRLGVLPAEAERPFSQKWHERRNLEQPPAPPNTGIDEALAEIERCRLDIRKLEIKCRKLEFQNDRMAKIITRTLRATAKHDMELVDRDRASAEIVERMAVLKAMFRLLSRSYVLKIGAYSLFSQKKFDGILKRKNIFDSNAYLARYPDVNNAKVDPISHYAAYGISEGRDRGF